jgi:hypothetical protein
MHPPCLNNKGPNNNNITNITNNNNFIQPKKSTINFDQRIEELRIYKATYGHLNIKRDTHKCLYDFCSNVRSSVTLAQQQKASGNNNNGSPLATKQRIKLTSARMVALASIGFPWEKTKGRPPRSSSDNTNTNTTNTTTNDVNGGFDDSSTNNKQKFTFEERIEHLRAYKQQHGHTNVRIEQNKSLYAFCHNIRNARRTPGKLRAKVTDYRIAALDAIGFDWRLSSGKQQQAVHQEQEEQQRVALFNNPTTITTTNMYHHVDQNNGEDNNNNANPILPTNLSEAFGGTDNLPLLDGQQQHQQQQEQQYDGSLSIPTIPLFNPTLLLQQNEGYNNNINNNTITTTTNNKRSTKFDLRIEELSIYKKQHGHINIKRYENKRLYDFISNIRTSLKNLTKKDDKDHETVGAIGGRSSSKKCPRINLTTERMVALASVGFVWETPKGRPPAAAAAAVSGHNISDLDTINNTITTSTTKSTKISFEERIEHLRLFKLQHGHLNIKVEDDRSLYTFCHNIRNARRSKRGGGNDLTNDRLAALDAIGFDWRLKKQQQQQEVVGGISNNYDSNNNNMDPLSWDGGGEQEEEEESAMI